MLPFFIWWLTKLTIPLYSKQQTMETALTVDQQTEVKELHDKAMNTCEETQVTIMKLCGEMQTAYDNEKKAADMCDVEPSKTILTQSAAAILLTLNRLKKIYK